MLKRTSLLMMGLLIIFAAGCGPEYNVVKCKLLQDDLKLTERYYDSSRSAASTTLQSANDTLKTNINRLKEKNETAKLEKLSDLITKLDKLSRHTNNILITLSSSTLQHTDIDKLSQLRTLATASFAECYDAADSFQEAVTDNEDIAKFVEMLKDNVLDSYSKGLGELTQCIDDYNDYNRTSSNKAEACKGQ